MKRNVDLNEISDGKFYSLNDMVRADCQDCTGCSMCCEQMSDTIFLDPLDVFRLTRATGCSFDELLEAKKLELALADGIILPHLQPDSRTGACPFLSAMRCSIHASRPGFCRIFPLGRYYEDRSFSYILQTKECPKKRTKIKVSRWIDTPLLAQNQAFINDWHYFLEDLSTALASAPPDTVRRVQLYLLHSFYRTAYTATDEAGFYAEWRERLAKARTLLD